MQSDQESAFQMCKGGKRNILKQEMTLARVDLRLRLRSMRKNWCMDEPTENAARKNPLSTRRVLVARQVSSGDMSMDKMPP